MAGAVDDSSINIVVIIIIIIYYYYYYFSPPTLHSTVEADSLEIVTVVVQILSLIAFICSVVVPWQWYGGIGWTTFVAITGFLHSTASFIIHLINFFPDESMIALIIVSPTYLLTYLLDSC